MIKYEGKTAVTAEWESLESKRAYLELAKGQLISKANFLALI